MALRSVEARATTLDQLIEQIQRDHAPVRVLHNGEPVADLLPVKDSSLPPEDPNLRVTFSKDYDPSEPLSGDEWPSDLR
jgi:antitoxin (DNA-binding transcriptional repressor) of toxin-antitoxin stability system